MYTWHIFSITFLASFSAFMRNFSSFFRFSAEYSFRLFSFIIFSLIFLLDSFDVDDCSTAAAVVAAFLLLPNEMIKNGLRDDDDDVDDAGCGGVAALDVDFVLDDAVAIVAADGFVLILFAVDVDFAAADAAAAAVAVVLADVAVAMLRAGFSVGDTNARVLTVGFDLIGATFAVIPNFETADEVLVDMAVLLLPNSGTVSRDDVDDADFDFCEVYEANLIQRYVDGYVYNEWRELIANKTNKQTNKFT